MPQFRNNWVEKDDLSNKNHSKIKSPRKTGALYKKRYNYHHCTAFTISCFIVLVLSGAIISTE